MNKQMSLLASLVFAVLFVGAHPASASELEYRCSKPPLEVTFAVKDRHYSGAVNCGNLFLQSDIPTAPVVRWKDADQAKLYTLMVLDFDGNANGSWPDPVAPGENATVRHWIVGNIPGALLRGTGYVESASDSGIKTMSVLQPYRAPHIPMVSDRYGIYLFEQAKRIDFAAVTGPITNFDYTTFLDTHQLGNPKASNFFVAIYTSESPFSGKQFHGNDVTGTWHQGYGKGKLAPSQN
ncbi:YbhB/YbcL family Raf kinase inhibitor-like protein [Candidatus Binatus sp.]|uniref:YbhB/YbcL family Raf kinase inhibitor-like protein n=1 Tax=Candidatus Binatus sp. TaxID=2811406 RepID=UPI003C3EC09A